MAGGAPSVVSASAVNLAGGGYQASGLSPVTGSFTATGQSAAFAPYAGRGFNASLWVTSSFNGAIQLERSFDAGTTWLPLTANGTQIEKFTAACSEQLQEDEAGVQYRFNCTAFTSGTMNYRLSQ